jgi:hypothetical protein
LILEKANLPRRKARYRLSRGLWAIARLRKNVTFQ